MALFEQLVDQAQMNYSRYYSVYASGGTPYALSEKQEEPNEQLSRFAQWVKEADCILVGAASGLSAAGGGDFYYEDNASYRKYFGKYAEKYGFNGAFAGMMHQFDSREEFWGYLATFLHTTQTAPIRAPYLDLDAILQGKDFFILTTNQDTQFLRLYPEDKISQIQGDHRFFQCSRQCCDEVWDALKPVEDMIKAMGEDTAIPKGMVPKCPHCGSEMFPWVRGYGNFLQGTRYKEEYAKVSRYLEAHMGQKILFLELGVGRMTPMFIQEPFWNLTYSLNGARYISINDRYAYLPRELEQKGMAIQGNIAEILQNVKKELNK